MTTTTLRLSRILSAIALATTLAACGGEGDGGATLSVSGRLAGAAVTQAAGGVASSALVVPGGVEIHEVWMVIRDIKFGVPGVDGEINAGNGPFLLHVSGSDLSAPVTQAFTAQVPAGTYDELRFVVHKLEDFQTIGVPELDGPRASVAISMTVEGTSLVYTSELNEAQRIFGRFTVDEGATLDNVTVSIDPSGWFSGGSLDPRNPADHPAIDDNIRVSIDAFEDDNRDGSNDDGPNHT
jgi:hypothetical protein